MANIATKEEKILPSNALEEIRLGISVSDSADLPRLGLLENHFRLASACCVFRLNSDTDSD